MLQLMRPLHSHSLITTHRLHGCAPPLFARRSSRLTSLRAALALSPRAPRSPPPAPPGPAPPLPPLTDSFGRTHTYLRVSLTERCNLRCTYCMPPGGVPLAHGPSLLTPDETLSLVSTFARLGVNKVRLTGGEPTLRPDLERVVGAVSRTPGVATLAMTSNGVALGRARLDSLRGAGLTHLNLSLDTLQKGRFEGLSLRSAAHWDAVWASVTHALHLADAGQLAVKLNVVVMRGVNDDELPAFAALAASHAVQVRFIELMPFAGNSWRPDAVVGYSEQLAALSAAYPALAPVGHSGSAKVWRVPGHPGSLGFITTMSDEFCSSCSRLRLTADGHLRVCLHGDHEVDLKPALRGGGGEAAVVALIRAGVAAKARALGGKGVLGAVAVTEGRAMVKIGG